MPVSVGWVVVVVVEEADSPAGGVGEVKLAECVNNICCDCNSGLYNGGCVRFLVRLLSAGAGAGAIAV